MRYLVLSDLHGGSAEVERALSYFDTYQCDHLVLLGDLLNHGPRNVVPSSYTPPSVVGMLNAYKDSIISVRGNCDSEVDEMLFNFPCNAPYGYIHVQNPNGEGTQRIFLTHGHLYRLSPSLPKGATMSQEDHLAECIALRDKIGLKEGDIVLSGHTHIAGIFKQESGVININPGSTTIPKGGTKAGFAVIFEDRIELHSLDNELVDCYKFNFV